MTARYAALASFGRVAALLAELLPLSGARRASTVRNRTLRVGAQVAQPHTVETRDQPMAQGTGPVVVGLDGGYVRGRHRGEGRRFEVAAGKVIDAGGAQHRSVFVRNNPAAATEVFRQALAAAGVDADEPAALGGEPIATSFVESAVGETISWRMAKAQQMRWSRGTVQPFLDVRAAPVLNDTLEDAFRRRYPNSGPRTMTRPCQRRDRAPEICALFIGGGRDRPALFSASVSVERCPQAVSSAHHRTYRRAGSGYRRGRERRSSAPPFCPAPARRPRIHKRGQPSGSGLWKATLAGRAQQRLAAGERAPRPALRAARLPRPVAAAKRMRVPGCRQARPGIRKAAFPQSSALRLLYHASTGLLTLAVMEHVVELDVPAAGRLKIHTHAEGDPYISGCLRVGNIFEPHILTVLAAFLKPGDRFLDVGANIGWFAMIGSRLVSPSGQVYALEPDPDNHRLLRANLAANECYNVKHWRCAAGSQSRRAMLSRSSTNRGDHRVAVREITGDTTPVKVRAVDRLLWWNRRVDVALIDTQGSEVNVFRGMRSILRRSPKIRIIFEYWPHGLESCGCSVKELAAIVQEHGWRMWLLEPETPPQEIRANDLVLLAQDRFTPASERHADVVALSPHDNKGIDFMRRLWCMDRSVAAKERS